MSKVIVIGGGAAGMYAACQAADCGHEVVLLEQNEKLGKKIYITGKGRCNLTNASSMETVLANVMTNRKFLYSAFYACDNESVTAFFEQHGVRTKIERGNRVFPVSDRSSDVIAALQKALKEKKVEIRLHTKAGAVLTEPVREDCGGSVRHKSNVLGVSLANGTKIYADSVIVATGGVSYPSTGATGDGYSFASETGHRLVPTVPALVPLTIGEAWCKELQGLSLRNIRIQVCREKKILFEDFGELLFTHFGVSGPVILSASSAIRPEQWAEKLMLYIDLKPALDTDQLDRRIVSDFEMQKNKQFKNALGQLFPAKLIPVMVELSDIDPDKKVNEISKEERRCFADLIKKLPLSITGTRGWNEAIITRGGVSVKDVDPSTMESRLVSNLYFCGEVLDLDAMTGGYNLQIAWSTGYLAGCSVK